MYKYFDSYEEASQWAKFQRIVNGAFYRITERKNGFYRKYADNEEYLGSVRVEIFD
jgi:hypothetical protein